MRFLFDKPREYLRSILRYSNVCFKKLRETLSIAGKFDINQLTSNCVTKIVYLDAWIIAMRKVFKDKVMLLEFTRGIIVYDYVGFNSSYCVI